MVEGSSMIDMSFNKVERNFYDSGPAVRVQCRILVAAQKDT
jgi:hypothetical protein